MCNQFPPTSHECVCDPFGWFNVTDLGWHSIFDVESTYAAYVIWVVRLFI